MAGINRHAQNNNLISKLYGETSSNTHRTFSAQDGTVAAPFAKGVFEQQVQERRELTQGYCVHLFFAILTSCCCCFESCYKKSQKLRRGTSKFRKFQIALERLSKEQDIQSIIALNRLSSMVHRINFMKRQRTALDYSHKYVITDHDVAQVLGG